MPTIIDSLKVVLGLDSSQFDAGRKKVDASLDATGAKGDKASDHLKKTGSSFNTVTANAAKFLAVIGGTVAIKRFLENQIEANSALDRLSKNLNTSVESISAWSNATEQAGGSAEGLQGTFDMLSKSQTELMLTGQSALIPYFSALGVSMATANGKARPLDDILLDLSGKFEKMDRPTANNMGRMMGIDQGTMGLLLKGRNEVELMIKRQKEFGAVSSKQAEEASRLKRAITDGKQAFSAFGRELMTAAMPAIEGILRIMADLGGWMRDNKEFVTAFLTLITAGLVGLAAAITPINLTAAAIVALAGGIALLWQDYQTWKRGGDSLIDWSKWEPGIAAATKAISFLRDLLEDVMYRAIAAADAMAAIVTRDWARLKVATAEFKAGTGKEYGAPAKPATVPAQRPAPAASPAAPATDTKERDQQAMTYFQRQGWTSQQAAGIVANIKRESNFDAAATGDSGKAYGLAQWHPDRQAEFQKRYKKPIQGSSLDEQLAFIQYELTLGTERKAGDKLRGATTPEAAAGIVSTHYERPADTVGESAKRATIAAQLVSTPKAAPGAPLAPVAATSPAAGAPTPPAPAMSVPGTTAAPITPARIPGAAAAAAGAGAIPTAERNAPPQAANVSKSVETHIGAINVSLPNATDGASVARGLGQSMDYLFTSQANYGLS